MEFEDVRTLKECIISIENTISTIMDDGNENKAVYAYYLGKDVARARDIIVKAYQKGLENLSEYADKLESEDKETDPDKEKLERLAEENKFEVGDLVYTSIAKDGSYLDLGVIISFGFMQDDKALNVMSSSGNLYGLHNRENWHKTGEHFDLQGILDRIEECAKKGKN